LCCGDATCTHRLQVLAKRLGHGGEGRIVDTLVILGVLPSASAADAEACAYISEGVSPISRSPICSLVPRLFSSSYNHTSTTHLYLAAHPLFSPEAMLCRRGHTPAPCLPPPPAICCGRQPPPATCPPQIFNRAPGAAACPQTWSLCHRGHRWRLQPSDV
jgi:hypothetical protein